MFQYLPLFDAAAEDTVKRPGGVYSRSPWHS
jgi:hypothetical protein